MIFVKEKDLKIGMRLARPIYNKKGVLVYERNSQLTQQGIESVKNFGIIGLFILEPAEPIPPMTEDDIEFERFQTVQVFAIRDELQYMIVKGKADKLQIIVDTIMKKFGYLDGRINFIQSLRSREDSVYKHTLNVAILCAMICHKMNMKISEKNDCVTAAIVHDVGKAQYYKRTEGKKISPETEERELYLSEAGGYHLIENLFVTNSNIKRNCMQCQKILRDLSKKAPIDYKIGVGAKAMVVAECFDSMTAMKYNEEPQSEVKALKYLLEHPEVFDPAVVDAFIRSVNLLSPGTCVELNNKEKCVVIRENTSNVLRPMLLSFRSNKLIDLGNLRKFRKLEIVDIMKTLDNRYIFDRDFLRKNGYQVQEPKYAPIKEPQESKA